MDEYLPQEQQDALEVIAWIAGQLWCTGKVGMMGISWGGFNSLQIAAHRPPALKAIITVCSTDNLYTDDCYYLVRVHLPSTSTLSAARRIASSLHEMSSGSGSTMGPARISLTFSLALVYRLGLPRRSQASYGCRLSRFDI